jgi:hypothetical protein
VAILAAFGMQTDLASFDKGAFTATRMIRPTIRSFPGRGTSLLRHLSVAWTAVLSFFDLSSEICFARCSNIYSGYNRH